jgi:hypothetical protein
MRIAHSYGMKVLPELVTAAICVLLVDCNVDPGSAEEVDPLASTETPSAATDTATTYIARSATWWFWNDGVDRETSFSDPSWQPEPGVSIATAPLGYGVSYVNPISYGGDPAHRPMTAYFRKAFYVEDPRQIGALCLDVMYDDGFVFYINGHEGGRGGLPAGPIGYATAAYSHDAKGAYDSFIATGSIPDLVAGWNTLALEIHQESPASSDLVFDAALVSTPRQGGRRHANHQVADCSSRHNDGT